MILSMEKTMVTMVISELKSVSRLKIFPQTDHRDRLLGKKIFKFTSDLKHERDNFCQGDQ